MKAVLSISLLCVVASSQGAALNYDRESFGYQSYRASSNIGFYSQTKCKTTHIDHVVSLKDAHDTGAEGWPTTQKEAFANDRLNHVVSCAWMNMSKSSLSPLKWYLRSTDGRGRDYDIHNWCRYVLTYTFIKNKYGLHILEEDYAVAKRCKIPLDIGKPETHVSTGL
jgi:hypothetical protein